MSPVTDRNLPASTTTPHHQVLDNVPMPIVVVEASLRVNFINSAARTFFNLSPASSSEMYALGAEDLFGQSLQPCHVHPSPSSSNTLQQYSIPQNQQHQQQQQQQHQQQQQQHPHSHSHPHPHNNNNNNHNHNHLNQQQQDQQQHHNYHHQHLQHTSSSTSFSSSSPPTSLSPILASSNNHPTTSTTSPSTSIPTATTTTTTTSTPPPPTRASPSPLLSSFSSSPSTRKIRCIDSVADNSSSWPDRRITLTCYPANAQPLDVLVSLSSFRPPVDYFALTRSTPSGHALSPSLSDGGTASPPSNSHYSEVLTTIVFLGSIPTPNSDLSESRPTATTTTTAYTDTSTNHPSTSKTHQHSSSLHPNSPPHSSPLKMSSLSSASSTTSASEEQDQDSSEKEQQQETFNDNNNTNNNTSLSDSQPPPPVLTRSTSSTSDNYHASLAERYRQILDYMPQMIFTTSPSGSHNYFNHRWYDFTGLTPEQSLGAGWTNPFHHDDIYHSTLAWSNSLLTEKPFSTEYRCKSHDGTWRWMLGRALPFKDDDGKIQAWFGTLTDVDEFVAIRSKLAETEKQVLSLINGADMTLISISSDLTVTHFQGPPNAPSFGANLRPPDLEIIGSNFNDAFPLEEVQDALQDVLNGSKKSTRFQIRPKDPKATWYRCMITPIVDGNVISGAVIVALDISDVKEAEVALKSSFEERQSLMASETAAREASRLKSDWAKNISHEIRTPISGMLGMAELMRDDPDLSPDHRESVIKIIRAGKILLDLIGMVLDLGKIEAGKLDLERRPFHLSELMADATMFEADARKKKLEFVKQLDVPYDGYLIGDVTRIRQVQSNLLANAIKFTHHGHVHFTVSQIRETPSEVAIKFEVQDTGVGIDEKVIPSLFAPFQQAEVSTSRKFGGTGLGLSISKTLVELMAGEIHLNSTLGEGTHTYFWIPFPKAQPEDAPPVLSSPQGSTPSQDIPGIPNSNIWVLVAEDNDLNREIFVRFLRRKNFNVEQVTNGLDAMQKLRERQFDVLIVDGHMPDLDGLEAAKLIRSDPDPQLNRIKLIAVTASAMRGDRERFIAAGMDDYLAKPIRLSLLEDMIKKHIRDRYYPTSTPSLQSSEENNVFENAIAHHLYSDVESTPKKQSFSSSPEPKQQPQQLLQESLDEEAINKNRNNGNSDNVDDDNRDSSSSSEKYQTEKQQ